MPQVYVRKTTDNGWSDGDTFMQRLRHFKAYAKPSQNDPAVLILDGHHSHKTLQAVESVAANYITMITLPPHCTHKLQPCDRFYLNPLNLHSMHLLIYGFWIILARGLHFLMWHQFSARLSLNLLQSQLAWKGLKPVEYGHAILPTSVMLILLLLNWQTSQLQRTTPKCCHPHPGRATTL